MNKTFKAVLISVIVVLVVVGGIFAYKWVQKIIDYNISLTIQKINLEKLLEEKEEERKDAYVVVDSLSSVVDQKDREIAINNIEIAILTDSLKVIPIVAAELPPSESYDSLQTIFVDTTGNLEYGFSGSQVQDIYVEVLTTQVLININEKLIDINNILQSQVITSKEIEEGLREIIAGYEEENAALIKHVSNIDADNIRVRTQRNIFAGVSGGTLLILALIIAL